MSEETLLESPVDETPIDTDVDAGQDAEPIESDPIEGQEAEVEAENDDLDTPDVEEEAETEEPAPTDGRKMPDGLKKAIASLKATNPEAAKQIKGLFWADQEYRAAFAKPADAVAAKNLIDEIGGQEGIQSIQAEREEWSQIDSAFAEGKPDFVKGLAEGNPEAFLKTAPHVINEFQARAPEQYQYYANNVAINTLAATGITIPNLAAAYQSYKDNPQAQAIIAEVHNALAGLKEKATAFETKRNSVDPEREKLNQEKAQFESQRRANFESGVAEKAEKYRDEKIQPEINRIIGNRKIDEAAMKGYQKMVQDEVARMLGEVPGFEKNLDAHYRTGDAAKSEAYIKAQYNRILPIAAKVIEPFLKNIPAAKGPTPGAKTATPGKPAGAGEVVLKEMPDYSQIDFTKCTVADVMQGKAVLKSGKKATGWA